MVLERGDDPKAFLPGPGPRRRRWWRARRERTGPASTADTKKHTLATSKRHDGTCDETKYKRRQRG